MKAAIAGLTPGGTRPLALLRTAERLTRRDWLTLAVLGLVGHFLYQVFFAVGLTRTSVANASLIIGCTPIVVSIGSALIGRDRLGPWHWAGIAVSALGMYLVVGTGAALSGASLAGDAMMFACVLCWTIYTLTGQGLLVRHSPLVVTGWSMSIGTVAYIPYSLGQVRSVDWPQVHAATWIGIVLSALLALNLSYVIWYAAVQRLGSARTSIYSNLVPVTALVTAAIWLAEPIPRGKQIGAAFVITGLLVSRVRRTAVEPPAEE
jgi:drug/metabolite transporter (DMT)-like permease